MKCSIIVAVYWPIDYNDLSITSTWLVLFLSRRPRINHYSLDEEEKKKFSSLYTLMCSSFSFLLEKKKRYCMCNCHVTLPYRNTGMSTFTRTQSNLWVYNRTPFFCRRKTGCKIVYIWKDYILYRCFVSVSSHGAPSVEWRKRRAWTRHFWEVAKRGTNYICTHRGVLLTFRNLDIVFHRYKNCDAERQKSTGEPNSQAWYRLILWCGTALNSVAKH